MTVSEIFPLEVKRRDGETVMFAVDEHPRRGSSMEKLASLKPLHPEIEGFSITAGNAGGMNDGAAASALSGALAPGQSALFQLDTMEVLVSLLASGACEKYPEFNFVLGESGVTWLPYVFDRLDTEYHDRARALGFKMKPSDYFRRQGYVTYQQDKYLEPIVPLIGEDNIIWGADYPHPDAKIPGVVQELLDAVKPLPDASQRLIVGATARAFYDL